MLLKFIRRLLKWLHNVSSLGLMGGLVAHIVLVLLARAAPLPQALVLRRAIEALCDRLMYPAVLVMLLSGLLATVATRAFYNAGWVWLKVGLGIPVLEVSMSAIRRSAHEIAALTAQALAGRPDAEGLSEALYREWAGLWMVIVLSVINVALAIWRPKIIPATKPSS